MNKLLDAERKRQAGEDIEIILTPDELDRLREKLPLEMGGVKKDPN